MNWSGNGRIVFDDLEHLDARSMFGPGRVDHERDLLRNRCIVRLPSAVSGMCPKNDRLANFNITN